MLVATQAKLMFPIERHDGGWWCRRCRTSTGRVQGTIEASWVTTGEACQVWITRRCVVLVIASLCVCVVADVCCLMLERERVRSCELLPREDG